jgi:heme-degrading monooxygenase HmoA
MVVTIFKVRTRPGVDIEEYNARVSDLLARAQRIPGFVSIKGYAAEDGERLALVEFANEDALVKWRGHSEHLVAQELGRTTYYSEYQVQICNTVREYSFKPTGDQSL